MFRWLFLLLIFAISLHALSDIQTLKRADGLMKSKTNSDHFRAYNDYKNIYLRAIMSDDKKLKVSSLQGIVKSGNKLHIDISQYSKELSQIKEKKIIPSSKVKTNNKS